MIRLFRSGDLPRVLLIAGAVMTIATSAALAVRLTDHTPARAGSSAPQQNERARTIDSSEVDWGALDASPDPASLSVAAYGS